MRVAIASAQGGLRLKSDIARRLRRLGHDFRDFALHEPDDVDYPDCAVLVARAVASGEYERGILVCGTGQGTAISASKITRIRAGVCQATFSARMSRKHNHANVLCLGERVAGSGLAAHIVETWLRAEFSGDERHRRRVNKINTLDEG